MLCLTNHVRVCAMAWRRMNHVRVCVFVGVRMHGGCRGGISLVTTPRMSEMGGIMLAISAMMHGGWSHVRDYTQDV